MTPNRLAFEARASLYDGLQRDLRQLVWINFASLTFTIIVFVKMMAS